MERRRLWVIGMWAAALAAIAAIYLTCEPERDDGRTREAGDAPTYLAGRDLAPPSSRARLAVGPDEGSAGSYRGGARHTGRSPHRGPAHAELAFRYGAGDRITAQAVVGEDGTIFVGTHGHALHAITPEGTPRWTAPTHHRVWSAAAVRGDTVYVGSDAGALFAFDAASGALRWRFRAEGDVDGAVTVGDDGTLYFTGGPFLYAVSAEGQVRWRFRARGPFLLTAPALDSDGTLYVASIDDRVYAVAADGRMRWEVQTQDDVSSSPVIGDDGTIYFGSDDGHVYAVTRDGERRWRTHVDGYVRAPLALGRNGDVIVAVYGPRPRVLSLDAASGELGWYFPVRLEESSEIGVASGPLVDVDGSLYFGAQDDFIYSLGADGALRWIHRAQGDVDAAPVLTEDGTLLIGSDDGFVYAFREGAGPDAGPEGEALDAGTGDAGVDGGPEPPIAP